MRRLFVILSLLLLLPFAAKAQSTFRVAFWNVENFFDCQRDSLKADADFTPEGDYHWTPPRFVAKRNNIYKVLMDMGSPAVVGLAEVENASCLRQLTLATPLRKLGYQFVHFESPDARGIDCALLYRKSRFKVFFSQPISLSDTLRGYRTRDLLLVEGVADGRDTLCLVVCHLPSKRGGSLADHHRMQAAATLRHVLDTLKSNHPSATVLAMGDFNAESGEAVFSTAMGIADGCFHDLMAALPPYEGTYKYQGRWSYIDHFVCSRQLKATVFSPDYLLTPEANGIGAHPFRTYRGDVYLGGFSDHLPIFFELKIDPF